MQYGRRGWDVAAVLAVWAVIAVLIAGAALGWGITLAVLC